MSIVLHTVTTPDLRDAVYRFRYDVCVREFRRRQHYADHEMRRIVDPLDATGIVLAAVDSAGQVVGTARTNILRQSRIPAYEGLYGLPIPGVDLAATSVTTRLLVAPSFRGGVVTRRLVTALHDIWLAAHVTHDFIDCNNSGRPFLERLGYQRLRHIDHPEYDRANLMRLDLGHCRPRRGCQVSGLMQEAAS